MSKASSHPFELGRPATCPRMIDKYSLIPILACAYASIVFPLILTSCSPTDSVCLLGARPESRIFWPAMAAVSIAFAAQNLSRMRLAPHIICLLGYVLFAGTSVLWAFSQEVSFIRFALQTMIITSIIIPAALSARTTDMMRALFLTFALASFLNLFFIIFGRPPIEDKFATWGYPGYFSGKNYLGECAAIAFLLSLYEILHPGWRRVLGLVVAAMAIALLFLSNSKSALGLALLVPLLAQFALLLEKKTRISLAIILWTIPLGYIALSTLSGITVYRLSYMLFDDPTFTGRTIIWNFVQSEIARRPLEGWGYQSFWLAGPDAPGTVDAPDWIKTMPNAHNGYLDTLIEMGYIGFILLLIFVTATVHAIGRMANRDFSRAWLLLSVALYIIITNGLESLWMRGFEMLWVVFVIIAAEVARYSLPLPPTARSFGARGPRRGAVIGLLRRTEVARQRVPAISRRVVAEGGKT
jgi:exopolysaccharide production protein ExoQ